MKGRNPRTGLGKRAARRRRARQGISVLVVLLLLSTTLALSYAILRSQGTALQLQDNATLHLSARQAAMSGIAVGLKKMHDTSWDGVDSSLSGTVRSHCTFKVDFRTGDPSLTSSSPDYSEYPYRVSLVSTGTATDAGDTNRSATYRVRAVVRLIPRKLPDEPSEWFSMTTNTVHQYNKTGSVTLAVPCRIEGTIRSYGKWDFPAECKWGSTEETDYLRDLNSMRLAGMGDYRPFDRQMTLPFSKQPSGLIDAITALGITPNDLTMSPADDWDFPANVRTYQIYPGGKTYSVSAPPLSHYLWSTTLQPHPMTNPLGIFGRDGSVALGDNVTVQGTLLQSSNGGNIVFSGRSVQITPLDLPAIYPDTRPVQLPVVMARRDFQIAAGAQGSITGLVAAWRQFDVATDHQGASSVEMACRIVAQDLHIHGLDEWKSVSSFWWQWLYALYYLQQSAGDKFFPRWLKTVSGLDYSPRIVIRPDTRSINYHYPWLSTSNPIYVAHPDDGGLRWEVVDWTENPSN